MEMSQELNIFALFNTASILQPMVQEIIATFRCYLSNIFCKTVAAPDSDSSDGSGQS